MATENATVESDDDQRTGDVGHKSAGRFSLWVVGLFGLILLLCSVLTVLRLAAENLQANAIWQSVMSVQDSGLFLWGQPHSAAVIPFLASPFADPDMNLYVVLLIGAACLYGLLLVLSLMGLRLLTGGNDWRAALVIYLCLTAITQVVLIPTTLHKLLWEGAPLTLSWLCCLLAFLLWRRRQWWALVLSALTLGIAIGAVPYVVLGAAFLGLVEMVRRRQWLRWSAFLLICIGWLGVWLALAAWAPTASGPNAAPETGYFTFSVDRLSGGTSASLSAIAGAFSPLRLVFLIVVACFATLLLEPQRRALLWPRFALLLTFLTIYWSAFLGNEWAALNGYPVQFFFPLLVGIVLTLTAPIAGALLTVRVPRLGTAPLPAAVGATAVVCVAAFGGPLTLLSQAPAVQQVQAPAAYVATNDVSFVAGYYWSLWPTLHQSLTPGRTAAFAAGYNSGGDPAAYRDKLNGDLNSDAHASRAMCVNDALDNCLLYLNWWTRPGWVLVPGESCPIPGPTPLLGGPPQQSCQILEFRPS